MIVRTAFFYWVTVHWMRIFISHNRDFIMSKYYFIPSIAIFNNPIDYSEYAVNLWG